MGIKPPPHNHHSVGPHSFQHSQFRSFTICLITVFVILPLIRPGLHFPCSAFMPGASFPAQLNLRWVQRRCQSLPHIFA